MYDIFAKKQRWHKREYRNIIKYINSIEPEYKISDYYNYEVIKVRTNLFFRPMKKYKKDIILALVKKTEEIVENKPDNFDFCKVVLSFSENNVGFSNIIIFFDNNTYSDFFDRDNSYQKWKKIKKDSILDSINFKTFLNESCYLEFLYEEDYTFKNILWFYEG